jgi:hypothetical protein
VTWPGEGARPVLLRAGLTIALIFSAFGLRPATAAPSDVPAPNNCKAWKYTPVPGFDPGGFFLNVSATAPTDAWAVGRNNIDPVIGHWDGRGWSPIDAHDPHTELYGVAAIAPDDAWAAGVHLDLNHGTNAARILHWNGATWGVFPAPTGGDDATLYGLSASSADNAWAVGIRFDGNLIHGLTLHWDGTSWTEVRPVQVTSATVFYAVSAIAADDVWAVGYDTPGSFEFQPLVEHWDGTQWRVVETPVIEGDDNSLYAVSGTGPDDVWAVGLIGTGTPPIVEHWDGTEWRIVKAAGKPSRSYALVGVVAIAPDDAWAVGQSVLISGSAPYPAAEHWDGLRWSLTSMWAPTESTSSALFGVGASSSSDIWGVGYVTTGDSGPLAEHAEGPCP